MSWYKVKLGKLGRVVTGKTPPTKDPDNFGSDFPFITPGDMHGTKFANTTERKLSLKGGYVIKGSRLPPGSVCVSCIGSDMGNVLFTTCDSFTNQQINSIIPSEQYCADFIYYLMKTKKSEILGIGTAGGSAVPIISKSEFCDLDVAVPDLSIQRRIASVLGAYDDLIENNRRRIALLEKMARELYRERFVRRVKGVGKMTLEQIAKFVRGKVIVKDATTPGDIPVVAGGMEPAYYHNVSNTGAPVITVSGSGANAGYARMYFENVWASDCSWVDAERTPYIRFAYCFLKDNDAELRNAQKGAAQPHVHAKDVNALMVSDDIDTIMSFEKLVTPMFDEIASLTFQTRNLTRQRDRLLPRLMSGKIVMGGGE